MASDAVDPSPRPLHFWGPVADVENLIRSARDAGLDLDPRLLTDCLRRRGVVEKHAVLTRHENTAPVEAAFANAGWHVHAGDCRKADGRANADTQIAAVAGLVVGLTRPAAMFLLTGDGELGCGIASSVRALSGQKVSIIVGAFAGARSARLSPLSNPDIDEALVLGPEVAWPSAKVRLRAGPVPPQTSHRCRWSGWSCAPGT
jgi:hypothetical protein